MNVLCNRQGLLLVAVLLLGCEGSDPSSSQTCAPGENCNDSGPQVQGFDPGDSGTQLPAMPGTNPGDSKDAGVVDEPDTSEGTSDTESPTEPDTSESDSQSGSETEVLCGDGLDDDGDNLIDCTDPDCAGDVLCVETLCGDGIDNDSDGDVDCADKNCFGSEACNVETCQDFYYCLAETGCGCTLGQTCPEVGSPAFVTCQETCVSDESGLCPESCLEPLEPTTQINVSSFQSCTKANCAGEASDDDYYDCILSICLDEYSQCFYTGVLDCGEFYYQCANDCEGNEDCIEGCKTAMSPEGFSDAVEWDTCRYDMCNNDGDDTIDSDSCYYLGSFFACASDAGTCIPSNLTEDKGSCTDVADCLLSCSTFEESDCVLGCLELVGPSNAVPVSDLVTCMVTSCGSTAETLTPQCAAGALANSCQAEWTACSL